MILIILLSEMSIWPYFPNGLPFAIALFSISFMHFLVSFVVVAVIVVAAKRRAMENGALIEPKQIE